eukprot:749645-Prorocentrum_minimum.AAC.1
MQEPLAIGSYAEYILPPLLRLVLWHQLAMRNFAALGKRMVNGSVWATGAVFAPIDAETGGYPETIQKLSRNYLETI